MSDAIIAFVTIGLPLAFAGYAFIEILRGNLK